MARLDEHLETIKSMDPLTGKIESKHLYRGKECPTKPISGDLVTRYVGYYLILNDLEDAEAWMKKIYEFIPVDVNSRQDSLHKNILGEIVDRDTDILIKSLFFSSIIFYAKCFTRAGGRRVKLERNIVPTTLFDKHCKIMKLRNTVAAHSGHGEYDTGTVDVLLPPVEFLKDNVGIHIRPSLKRLNFINDRNDSDNFLSLISAVKKKVDEKTTKLGDKIIWDLVVPKGRDYWYQND